MGRKFIAHACDEPSGAEHGGGGEISLLPPPSSHSLVSIRLGRAISQAIPGGLA